MIEVKNLNKSFGNFKSLDNLSLNVKKGSVYGLVGPNGAGKTTFIKNLMGIYRPDSGSMTVNGEEVYENPALKQKIIYISDDLFLVDEAYTSPGTDNSKTYIVIANNCIKTNEKNITGTELIDYGLFSEKELEYLKTEKRAEISERIKIALGFGDLSENSEYDEAKNAQAENEALIVELENKVRYAKIIDESEIDTKTVQVGNTVKLLDMEFNEEVTYTIVGSTEVDLTQNRISNESPMGKALLGAKKNQTVEVQAPAGVIKYKILSITK